MWADSVPSSKTNIFQSKLYTLIYCCHLRTYSLKLLPNIHNLNSKG
jgi:hypothetical protein